MNRASKRTVRHPSGAPRSFPLVIFGMLATFLGLTATAVLCAADPAIEAKAGYAIAGMQEYHQAFGLFIFMGIVGIAPGLVVLAGLWLVEKARPLKVRALVDGLADRLPSLFLNPFSCFTAKGQLDLADRTRRRRARHGDSATASDSYRRTIRMPE